MHRLRERNPERLETRSTLLLADLKPTGQPRQRIRCDPQHWRCIEGGAAHRNGLLKVAHRRDVAQAPGFGQPGGDRQRDAYVRRIDEVFTTQDHPMALRVLSEVTAC